MWPNNTKPGSLLCDENRGSVKSVHLSLCVGELKRYYNIVINISLKLKWKIYLNVKSVKWFFLELGISCLLGDCQSLREAS